MPKVPSTKLLQELKRRIKSPWYHETFKAYFFGVIIGFGGLGIWLPNVVKAHMNQKADWAGTSNELAMFSSGILATALVDMTLSEEVKKPLKLYALLALSFGLLFSFLLVVFESLPFAILFTVASLLIWWMANADNEMLYDDDPQAALGGNIDDIQGPGIT